MTTYDLTRLDLSDLDQALITHVLGVGEPVHVERKRDIPTPEQLSELLGSMGNTEGGWALFGVEDDGQVTGLPASRADLQDEIRDRVQRTLDPLPNFAARRITLQSGHEVGVVRVYPSEDTPLVSTHKGAPYIRLPGGKRPVNTRHELDVLIERGRGSDREARELLRRSSVTAAALEAPELNGAPSYPEPTERQWILRAAPLGLDPNFAGRVRTNPVRAATEEAAKRLLPPPGTVTRDEYVDLTAVGRGWITWGQRVGDAGAGAIIVDPAGVIAAVARERGFRSLINIEPLVEETIIPLISAVIGVFAAAGVSGRFICDLHARGFAGVMLQAQGQGAIHMPTGTRASAAQAVNSNASLDELRAAAKRLAADVAADAGLLTFS